MDGYGLRNIKDAVWFRQIEDSRDPSIEPPSVIDLKMTKDLADISKWDDDAINLRQNNFTPLALEIWNIESD